MPNILLKDVWKREIFVTFLQVVSFTKNNQDMNANAGFKSNDSLNQTTV